MPLWKNSNSQNNAPKFITDITDGDSGVDEYGTKIIYNDGKMGLPVPSGWVRKTVGTGGKEGRVTYETIVAMKGMPRIPNWVPVDGSDNPADLVLDLENNRGWYDGGAYASESSVLNFVDGIASGNSRKIGNYVDPNEPELLTNGDLSSGIGDWTTLNGSTSNVVDGHLEMSGTGLVNPTIRSGVVPTQQGKAYRLTSTYWRGTSSTNVFAFASKSTTMSPASNGLTPNSSTTPATNSRTFGGEGSTTYVGLRTAGGPNGTVYGDDFSVKQASVFSGFTGPDFTTIITFKTPSSLPATPKVLFSFDDDGSRNRYRCVLNATGTITVVIDSSGTTRQTQTIPSELVTLNAEHKIHVSNDGSSRLMIAFDEVNLFGQQGGFTPAGFCWVRFGSSPTAGEEWTGEILNASIFNREVVNSRFIWAVGDSYVSGTGGASVEQGIEASDASRLTIAAGIGGSSIATQLSKMKENPGLYSCVLVHWDGDANLSNILTDPTVFNEMSSLVDKHIFVGSGLRMNHSQQSIDNTLQRNSWLSSNYGTRYIDPMPTLIGLATSSPEDLEAVSLGRIPPSCLQADGTHLTPIAMQAIGSVILQKINDLGW